MSDGDSGSSDSSDGGESGGGYDSEYTGITNTNGCLGFAVFLIVAACLSGIYNKYLAFDKSGMNELFGIILNLTVFVIIAAAGFAAYSWFTQIYKNKIG